MKPPRKSGKASGARRGGGAPGKPPQKVRHEHSAGILLFQNTPAGRIYLVLNYGKHWDYPKGHLEKGETAWQAAVRELFEETGIRGPRRVGTFQQDMHYWFYSPRKGRVHKRVTFFVAESATEAVTLSDEHVGYAWLPLREALGQLTYENARTILSAADLAIEQPPSPAPA